MSSITQKLAVLAAIGGAALGGTAIAGAAAGATGPSGPSDSSATDHSGKADQTALTGETAAKVKAAALAEQPGTLLRATTDAGGVYEAHIRKADGSEVEVRVDKSFTAAKATDVASRGSHAGRSHAGRSHAGRSHAGRSHGGRSHGGRGHGGAGRGAGDTALTGTSAAKVKAAALEEVPGGTVLRSEGEGDGTYEAHVRKSDGSEVRVELDERFDVTAVDEH